MKITINGQVLFNVAQFTSKEKLGYSFSNVIKFEIKKDFLSIIATEGNALCVYKTERAEFIDGQKDFILELNKIKFDKKALYNIDFKTEYAIFENCRTNKQEILNYFGGFYPDYKSVIPPEDKKPKRYVVINPDYLIKLKNCMPVKWTDIPYQEAENKACLWVDDSYKVVIMPIKVND